MLIKTFFPAPCSSWPSLISKHEAGGDLPSEWRDPSQLCFGHEFKYSHWPLADWLTGELSRVANTSPSWRSIPPPSVLLEENFNERKNLEIVCQTSCQAGAQPSPNITFPVHSYFTRMSYGDHLGKVLVLDSRVYS